MNLSPNTHLRRDPGWITAVANNNLHASLLISGLVLVLALVGELSLLLSLTRGAAFSGAIPEYVYLMMILFDAPMLLIFFWIRQRKTHTAPALILQLCSVLCLGNSFLAGLSILGSQRGGSLYLEMMLIMVPVCILPVFPARRVLLFVGMDIAVICTILITYQHAISWQDAIDLGLFPLLCLVLATYRQEWFAVQYDRDKDLKALNRTLYVRATTDPLTGLHNASVLSDDIAGMQGRHLCAAILDLDSFRLYNSHHGRDAGDRLLQGVALLLKVTFPDTGNVTCYRYGGDSFALLYAGRDIRAFLQKLSVILGRLRPMGESSTPVRACVGYCYGLVDDPRDGHNILSLAANYLYDARSAAPGSIVGHSFAHVDQSTDHEELDPLTGLLTRARLDEQLDLLNDRAERFCAVVLDIDQFSQINREQGYTAGDRILQHTAELLREAFPDDLLARSEDHFFLVTPKTEIEQTIRGIQQQLAFARKDLYLFLRCGICRMDDPQITVSSLRLGIDMAVYACHSLRGQTLRGICRYDHTLDEQRKNASFVKNHFRDALEQGQIFPHYQPLVTALSDRCIGYEALARWKDPDRGMLSPGIFVPVLEQTHESYLLDLHILRCVCEDLSATPPGRRPRFVSVNLSRTDFDACDVPSEVASIVRGYELDPSLLRIEITESVFSDSPQIQRDLHLLREQGFRIWLDDFGSGISSLGTLKNYSVSAVKLDMEFLKGALGNRKAEVIIHDMIRLCHSLGAMVIVEGVENEDQLQLVRQFGGNFIQGYYYSRPLPLQELKRTRFYGEQIPQAEYEYYVAATRIDVEENTQIVTGTRADNELIRCCEFEWHEDTLTCLRLGSGMREFAEKLGVPLQQSAPLPDGDHPLLRGLRHCAQQARESSAPVRIYLRILDSDLWIQMVPLSSLPGKDRVLLLANIFPRLDQLSGGNFEVVQ